MKQAKPERKKSPTDIKLIKEVQFAAEQAMGAVIRYIISTKNPSSEEAHKIISEVLDKYECESPEGCIVASGVKSSEPHYTGEGAIQKNVPIVIDIFPRSKNSGLFADISRTVCLGIPTGKLENIYHAVLSAQKLAISMIRPGVKCSDIHKRVEDFFIAKGYLTSGVGKKFPFAEGFVHSIGHGVGTNIHEAPILNRKSKDVLKEGDVITIEPGLYYSNIGGVRLEDMLLVTEDGFENLSNFPKFLKI